MSEEEMLNGWLLNGLSQALKQKCQADHEDGEQRPSSPAVRCNGLFLCVYTSVFYCKNYKTCEAWFWFQCASGRPI